jgi:RHS repeat-associated protein
VELNVRFSGQYYDAETAEPATFSSTAPLAGAPVLGPEWQLVTTGDYDGDGKAELFWHNSQNGTTQIWDVENGVVTQVTPSGTLGLDWQVQGSGDFNQDGTTDVIYRRDTGLVMLWEMAGNAIVTTHFPGGMPVGATLRGIGDFNADGTDDLIWRLQDGGISIWQISNLTVAQTPYFPAPSLSWTLQGAGDFNQDGTDDLLWENDSTNETMIYGILNNAHNQTYMPGSTGSDWQFSGIGDFDGDGTSDVLWKNTASGDWRVWEMRDHRIHQAVVLQLTYASGFAKAQNDFDGDGIDEVLWEGVSATDLSVGDYVGERSGLHYNYFRYYDPSTGRYITSDPIGLEGGFNPYLYANENPLAFADPAGLDVCLESTNNATVPFGLHQRVAIYDSSGKFIYGQSFGTTNPAAGLFTSEAGDDPTDFSGQVYPDVEDTTRDKKECTSTSDAENNQLINALRRQLGARGPYSATGIRGGSCRTYSAKTYDQIVDYLKSSK